MLVWHLNNFALEFRAFALDIGLNKRKGSIQCSINYLSTRIVSTDDIKSAMREINKLELVGDRVASSSAPAEVPLDLAPPMTPAVSPPRMDEGEAVPVYEEATEPQHRDREGFARPQAPISQPQPVQQQQGQDSPSWKKCLTFIQLKMGHLGDNISISAWRAFFAYFV